MTIFRLISVIAAEDDDADDEDDEDEDDGGDGDAYGGRFEKTMVNRNPFLEEPPEEEEENYILGCMVKRKSVYKCRYCPDVICLNEATMQAHVSSKVKRQTLLMKFIGYRNSSLVC